RRIIVSVALSPTPAMSTRGSPSSIETLYEKTKREKEKTIRDGLILLPSPLDACFGCCSPPLQRRGFSQPLASNAPPRLSGLALARRRFATRRNQRSVSDN